MWKIISLSALLVVTLAADINDFYGDWIVVAFFPAYSAYVPVCVGITLAKSSENVQCTSADGRNATLVQITNTKTGKMHPVQRPMILVNMAAEVMLALNVNVKCGDKNVSVSDRGVVRLVNEDYFVLYANIPTAIEYTRSEAEQNSAMLFGRKVVSLIKLYNVIISIEDLKHREGVYITQMCGTENNGGKSTEAKVDNA